jgi:hypothetical protein
MMRCRGKLLISVAGWRGPVSVRYFIARIAGRNS